MDDGAQRAPGRRAAARDRRETPISDYGAIGDLRTVALVSVDGSIDWWCAPHLSSPAVFAALVGPSRGGHFRVHAPASLRASHAYLRHTNVLETTSTTAAGELVVLDFMPLAGVLDGCGSSEATGEIHRIVECRRGEVDVEVEWAPRLDYARAPMSITTRPAGAVAIDARDGAPGGVARLGLAGLPDDAALEVVDGEHGALVLARFRLQAGDRVTAVTRWWPAEEQDDHTFHPSVPRSLALLEETREAWLAWVHKPEVVSRKWAGEWEELVIRSELALKLLTHGETGAIAAAATTSLPEGIGGVRNWDYRYAWIRDASLAAQALFAAGHGDEARAFLRWAEEAAERCGEGPGVRIMYGLHGETDLEELELDHLEGYRGSRPVRVGNGAAGQRQLDIYGELLDGAYAIVREGGELAPRLREFLRDVADHAAGSLLEEDDGIWELRNGPYLFTYSQIMLWTALDRAVILADRGLLEGDVERWRRKREEVRELVLTRGLDPERGVIVQRFDGEELDASSLLLGIHELLGMDDPRVQRTIDATRAELEEEGLVYRYRIDDGLPGEEGAFVLCTCWLVDALALSGRVAEARALFTRLVARAGPLGLFAEQIDPRTGAHLGNYPQAFSHIGIINSALYIAYAEGRELPIPPPLGTPEHRAEVARHRRPAS